MKTKKLLSILLAVTMAFSIFSICVNAEVLTYGDYEYTVDGSNATITKYKGTSTGSITTPKTLNGYTVTAIGEGAFSGKDIGSVKISSGVATIANHSFSNCAYLTSVSIPSTVTYIGGNDIYNDRGAFRNCQRLSTVTIADGTKDAWIDGYAFLNCKALKTITIPGNYISIGAGCFQGCFNLTSFTLNKNSNSKTQSIGSWIFTDLTELATVSLPDTLKTIPEGAFKNTGITSFKVQKGVATIANHSFSNCAYLKSVSIPSTVTYIGGNDIYNDRGAFRNCQRLSTVTIADGTKDAKIDGYAFLNCKALKTITIPGNYISIGAGCFQGCTEMTSFTLKKSPYDSTQSIGSWIFTDLTELATVSLPDTLKTIPEGAFKNTGITSFKVQKGVATIANHSFSNCAYLKSVSIPSTVTYIGGNDIYNDRGAFRNCQRLSTVTIADGTKDAKIDGYAFLNCKALKTITIPGNYISIGAGCFQGCTEMTSFTLKKSPYDSTQSIGSWIFSDLTKLTIISLPDTLKTIPEGAFKNTGITSFKVQKGVATIANHSFSNCAYLTSVSIPSTVTYIGGNDIYNDRGAFRNCQRLSTVTIADGTKDAWIDGYAFLNCKELKTIHIPKNYITIGQGCFSGCSSSLTICSTTRSCTAKTYADANGINFKVCSGHATATVISAPTVTAKNVSSSGKIKLTWNSVNDAVSYKVYRATSKTGTYKLMKTTTSTSYVNTSAVAGKTYYYKVKAVAADGTTSNYSSVITRTCDLAKPTGVKITVSSNGCPKVIWNAVEGATAYRVYRATSENGTYKLMKTVTSGTSYTNTSFSHGKTYYYKVKAVCSNSAADSAYSSVVSKYVK